MTMVVCNWLTLCRMGFKWPGFVVAEMAVANQYNGGRLKCVGANFMLRYYAMIEQAAAAALCPSTPRSD